MLKHLRPLLTCSVACCLLACNSPEPKQEETQKPAEPVVEKPVETAPATPEFKPFDVAEISHTVKDYAKWRPFFNDDSVNRKANGLDLIVVGRSADNPNKVLIALTVADVAKGKSFSQNPELKKVMDKAGVISKPDIHFFHVIRFSPDAEEKQWVIVTHKVKDFDAWLKVYDGEGPAARAEQGLYDAALARGIDDPLMVHLVFDIKDMAKAKAAFNSPEKKELMKSAGVEGAPKIEFYTSAE